MISLQRSKARVLIFLRYKKWHQAPSGASEIGLEKIGLKYIKTSHQLDGPHPHGVLIASRWPLASIGGFFRRVPWKKVALSAIIKTQYYGEIEVHTVHVPPASSNRRSLKVETFYGIYDALSVESDRHRILCGDFNSPMEETNNKITYWGGRKDERRSEELVLKDLKEHDLADTYRKLHSDYDDGKYSHVNKNPDTPNRRYDHIFSSTSLNPQKCDYLHSLRKGSNNKCLYRYEEGDLSDHSPVYAKYEPKLLRRPIKKKV